MLNQAIFLVTRSHYDNVTSASLFISIYRGTRPVSKKRSYRWFLLNMDESFCITYELVLDIMVSFCKWNHRGNSECGWEWKIIWQTNVKKSLVTHMLSYEDG